MQEHNTALPFAHAHRVRAQARQAVRQLGKFVEMGGEDGAAADLGVQGFEHRPGDGQPIECGGAPSDLVHHHQAARAGLMQDGGGLGHLDHEGGAAPREVVGSTHAAEQAIHHADARGLGRHGQSGLGEDDDDGVLAQEGGFSRHVGAGEQQHASVWREIAFIGHEGGSACQG